MFKTLLETNVGQKAFYFHAQEKVKPSRVQFKNILGGVAMFKFRLIQRLSWLPAENLKVTGLNLCQ